MTHHDSCESVSNTTMENSVKLPCSNDDTVTTHQLSFKLEHVHPSKCQATVIVPEHIVGVFYNAAAKSQQKSVLAYGFQRGEAPLDYIKQNFAENLTEHLKELLSKYCVVNFLCDQIHKEKLVVAGSPRLLAIDIVHDKEASFTFELSTCNDLNMYEWKYFPFKAPKRKNYKDLDRQVESFIQDERNKQQNQHNTDALDVGDWVSFNISFVNEGKQHLVENFTQNFWFKLGEDETESPLRQLFVGRKKGDIIFSDHTVLQEYFSSQLDTNYLFCIEITNSLSHKYFCFDYFKHMFRIKTNKDMHKKLIEVFSYRNDISQRHAMVEGALSTLISRHRFSAPHHFVLRQQKSLIDQIKLSPDYHVYRSQKEFQSHIQRLAEKQVTEMIFVDKLAHHENLYASDDDIKGYINLTNRPRMKEFIYFDPPSFKSLGQELPVPTEELRRVCLREKTINHIIYHLTKNR